MRLVAVAIRRDEAAAEGTAMTVVTLPKKPMHARPRAGQHVTVFMRDGTCLDCNATMIRVADRSGIVLYHERKAIDEAKAEGWLPKGPQ